MKYETRTSVLLTPALVTACVQILRPGVENFIKELPNRNVIYLVVLDPVHTSMPVMAWQGAIGEQDQKKWKGTYEKNAFAKASLSFRTKLSTHLVQQDQPYYFAPGDFKFGGAVYHHGIVVGASGLSQQQDLMIASALAGLIHGACIGDMVAHLNDDSKKAEYYFPENEEEKRL